MRTCRLQGYGSRMPIDGSCGAGTAALSTTTCASRRVASRSVGRPPRSSGTRRSSTGWRASIGELPSDNGGGAHDIQPHEVGFIRERTARSLAAPEDRRPRRRRTRRGRKLGVGQPLRHPVQEPERGLHFPGHGRRQTEGRVLHPGLRLFPGYHGRTVRRRHAVPSRPPVARRPGRVREAVPPHLSSARTPWACRRSICGRSPEDSPAW
jgi:hypothetical protein